MHQVDQLGTLARLQHLAREGTVDLELVERKQPQIVDRGEAGAEIVERYADTRRPEFGETPADELDIDGKHGFRDLDRQAFGRKPGLDQAI